METLYTSREISSRVQEMGKIISGDYAGKELLLLGVLKGSLIFLADLCREISVPVTIDFIQVKSYQGDRSTGSIKLLQEPSAQLEGKHLLVVEDIIDTGLTLDYIMKYLNSFRPASITIAAFLFKKEKFPYDYQIRYTGFEIEDKFVVGYGMDYNESFRNLKEIKVIE